MPLNRYCSKCSHPNQYTLELPHFCSKCGTSFDDISVATIKPKKITKVIEVEEEESIQEIQPSNFQIETIDFKEIRAEKERGITIGEIGQQKKTGFKRGVPKKVNVKKEIELFQIEASKPARVEVNDTNKE